MYIAQPSTEYTLSGPELDAVLHCAASTWLLLSLQLLVPAGTTAMNQDQPAILRWWNCIKKCTEDDSSSY